MGNGLEEVPALMEALMKNGDIQPSIDTSVIEDKKCEPKRRERGFVFDFRTLQNRRAGRGGGGDTYLLV